MSGSIARQAKAGCADTELFQNVACPFCGILCDDLEVERRGDTLKVRKNACGKSVAGIERKLPAASRRENRPSEVDLVAAEHLGVFLKGLTA